MLTLSETYFIIIMADNMKHKVMYMRVMHHDMEEIEGKQNLTWAFETFKHNLGDLDITLPPKQL